MLTIFLSPEARARLAGRVWFDSLTEVERAIWSDSNVHALVDRRDPQKVLLIRVLYDEVKLVGIIKLGQPHEAVTYEVFQRDELIHLTPILSPPQDSVDFTPETIRQRKSSVEGVALRSKTFSVPSAGFHLFEGQGILCLDSEKDTIGNLRLDFTTVE